jgi:starch-binding outer membrane protein SusE/F
MKSFIKKTLLLAFFAFGILSCSEDSKDPVAKQSEDLTLSNPTGGTYDLLASNAGEEIFLASWTSANYNYQAAVNYKLQLVKASATFDGDEIPSIDLGNFSSTAGLSFEKSVLVRDLNNLVLAANGGIGVPESYKIRVIGEVIGQLDSSDNNLADAVSQEVAITATAFDAFDEFDRIFVPGNYGGASGFSDWAPDNAPRLFSKANDGKYEGFVWMNNPNPEFKFTPVPSWTDDKGENNPSGAFSGVLGTASNIKPADGAGTYFFTVNWPALTYTMAKRQVAIIGAATPNGWGTPTYLTFDTNPASPYFRMYTIDLTLAQDEFLIRLRDDWSEKMGTLSGNLETLVATNANKIKIGGGNMKVPTAGNYKVVLNIGNSANYNLRLIPN